MRTDSPSLTALYVSLARAVASEDPALSRACHDPCAHRFFPAPLARALRDGGIAGKLLRRSFKQLSLGLCQHIALRTALIDRALAFATTSGIDQLVLLGAGFDCRAQRLEALSATDVYEVDHPATQRFKRARMRGMPPCARSLRQLACDFEREPLTDVLRASPIDFDRPCIWLWEGVTMYLTREAIDKTLATVAALSAARSMLLCTYLTPDLVATHGRLARELPKLLGLIAEPIRFAASPPEFQARLARHGFVLQSDVAPRDAAPHFAIELGAVPLGLPAERLVVAQREREP
jgi:methyltransferase (TIGR00027 family)